MLNGYMVLADGAIILCGILVLSWYMAKWFPLPRPMSYAYLKTLTEATQIESLPTLKGDYFHGDSAQQQIH